MEETGESRLRVRYVRLQEAPERRLAVGFGRTATRDERAGTGPPPKLSSPREKPATDPAVAIGFGGQGRRSVHTGPHRFPLSALPENTHPRPLLCPDFCFLLRFLILVPFHAITGLPGGMAMTTVAGDRTVPLMDVAGGSAPTAADNTAT